MLAELSRHHECTSFSLSAENPTGARGQGGRAMTGTGAGAARELGVGWKISPSVAVPAGQTFTLADYTGQGAIRHIWITDSATQGRFLVLRMYWDGSSRPSVETPLGDFFACANETDYRQLSSLAVCVNPRRGLNCYWEMPFRRGFRITVENISAEDITIYYQIDGENRTVGSDELYLHAQFRRSNPLPYKQCHTLVDGVHGCGQYAGTYLYWGTKSNGWWGEGEIKFYLDGDTEYPTVCGTGTEDYFCGSYDFDVDFHYVEFCTPYSGLYKVDSQNNIYQSQKKFNMYRWHIEDPVYFHSDLCVTIQALGWRSEGRYLPLQDDISSVAYWYSDRLDDIYPALPGKDGLELL